MGFVAARNRGVFLKPLEFIGKVSAGKYRNFWTSEWDATRRLLPVCVWFNATAIYPAMAQQPA